MIYKLFKLKFSSHSLNFRWIILIFILNYFTFICTLIIFFLLLLLIIKHILIFIQLPFLIIHLLIFLLLHTLLNQKLFINFYRLSQNLISNCW
jgi:hypothetical protein